MKTSIEENGERENIERKPSVGNKAYRNEMKAKAKQSAAVMKTAAPSAESEKKISYGNMAGVSSRRQ